MINLYSIKVAYIIIGDYKLYTINMRDGKWKKFRSKFSNQIYLIRYSFLFFEIKN